MSETNLHLLRHTVSTLAYRAAKVLTDVPDVFADFTPGQTTTRTPVQILAHMGDLFDWAVNLVNGQHVWHDSTPLPWDAEVARFFASLSALDNALTEADPSKVPCEKLFQGPISDALTHVGQIAMLRRMAAVPVRPENYFMAEIVIGQVGPTQATPRREF